MARSPFAGRFANVCTPVKPVTQSPTFNLSERGFDHLADAERPHDFARLYRRRCRFRFGVIRPRMPGSTEVGPECAPSPHRRAGSGEGARVIDQTPST